MLAVPDYKKRIKKAFNQAQGYDLHTQVHEAVAHELGDWIMSAGSSPGSLVLEAGCGTGVLAMTLAAKLEPNLWLCTDLSPAMLARSKKKFKSKLTMAKLAAMDMEALAVKPRFDLAVSTMALHWALDLNQALNSLWACLKPGGILAVALPGHGTFAKWRQACGELNLDCGLQNFPTVEQLRESLPGPGQIRRQRHTLHFAQALDFPRYLKALGAKVPRPGCKPLAIHNFRAALERLDPNRSGPSLDYHILMALVIKEPRG